MLKKILQLNWSEIYQRCYDNIEKRGETGAYAGGGRMMGVYILTPSAASNTPSPPQPMSNFVKHALQNTENDCRQWLSDSFRVHQIRFRSGLHPGPR